MSFVDIGPFAKIAAVVVALGLFGLVMKIGCSRQSDVYEDACKSLPMDKINPCLARARAECRNTADDQACSESVAKDVRAAK